MIRKVTFFLLCCISSVMYAQTTTGSFEELASCGKSNIEIDFSDVSIHGMQEDDFADVEKEWYDDKPEIIGYFISHVADKVDDELIIGTRLKTPFLIKVLVRSITKKGNFTCDVIVMNEDKEIATIEGLKEDGGVFGSKLNLIKDGAKHTGEKLGKFLSREIKKAKKH